MALLPGTETTAALVAPKLAPAIAAGAGYLVALAIKNRGQKRTFMPASAFDCRRSQKCGSLRAQPICGSMPVKKEITRFGFASSLCLAALDVKCRAVKTQPTVERSKTASKAPARDGAKTPKLDDNGPTLPPHGGGGGGGGGGGDSSGGWVLFAILLILSELKEKERKEEEEQEKMSYPTVQTLDF